MFTNFLTDFLFILLQIVGVASRWSSGPLPRVVRPPGKWIPIWPAVLVGCQDLAASSGHPKQDLQRQPAQLISSFVCVHRP